MSIHSGRNHQAETKSRSQVYVLRFNLQHERLAVSVSEVDLLRWLAVKPIT